MTVYSDIGARLRVPGQHDAVVEDTDVLGGFRIADDLTTASIPLAMRKANMVARLPDGTEWVLQNDLVSWAAKPAFGASAIASFLGGGIATLSGGTVTVPIAALPSDAIVVFTPGAHFGKITKTAQDTNGFTLTSTEPSDTTTCTYVWFSPSGSGSVPGSVAMGFTDGATATWIDGVTATYNN